jgi:hypothetical protein
MHETFLAALRTCHAVRVTFFAEEDGGTRTRVCYPMDFGPGRKIKDGQPRYWFWDSDSPDGPHTLGLLQSQVGSMADTNQVFDPASFVTWPPNWHIARDWGAFS